MGGLYKWGILALCVACALGAGGRLTVGDVVALVQAGQSVENILDTIQRSGARPQATPAQIADLTQRGVPLPAVLALRGEPLSLADVRRLASGDLSRAAWRKLTALVGVQRTALTNDDQLDLFGSVPVEVLGMLREGRVPAGGAAPRSPGPPAPAPTDGQEPAPSPAAAQDLGTYAHPGKRFVLRFPNAWHVVRAVCRSQPIYYVTPEAQPTDPRQLKVAVSLSLIPEPDASALEGLDAAGLLLHFLPEVRAAEPGLELAGDATQAKLGGLEAGTATLHGTLKGRPGEFTAQAFAAERDGVVFLVSAQAPKAQFEELKPAFLRIVQNSEFGRPKAHRTDKPFEARQLVEKYMGSIVSVVAKSGTKGGTGSGFIIRKDGYLLTNWHVIWNTTAAKPHETFHVEWDDGLHRKRQAAQLVAYRRKPSPIAFHWGVDIALLKIPAGDYEPVPLTALSEVGPGDPVVTLGFPSRSQLEGVSLTVSTGVVTRFNRDPDGKVESVLTDALSTHGSSGGPCVSLATGGAIGLNTYGRDIVLDPRHSSLNDLTNYHGVVPIDACLNEFPLIADLGLRSDGEPLDFFDSYALADFFLRRHSVRDAERLAARALSLNPRSADAHGLLATCKYEAALAAHGGRLQDARKEVQAVFEEYQKALACDPAHENTLVMLARIHNQMGHAPEAALIADQAVQANPESWKAHLVRAEVAFAQKQYEAALQSTEKAKAFSGGAQPEPYLVAGKAYYAQNSPEAGRKEYAAAARIRPANLEARLGVAQYHELKHNPAAAVAGYTAILDDFRDNPVVLARIAACYYDAAQYAKAYPAALNALRRFAKLGLAAPEPLFLQAAKMALDNKKDDTAINVCAACLSHYKKSDAADRVHLRLADLHAGKQRLGLANAHLREAKELRDSPEVNQLLQRTPPARLSLAEIKKLVTLEYPLSVAYELIAGSRLDFAVRSDEEAARLGKENGLPAAYLQAIRVALKHQAEAGPVTPRPPANPPPGNAVVGTWVAQGRTKDGALAQYTLRLMPDGRYTFTTVANGRVTEVTQGTCRLDAQTLSGRSDTGRAFAYACQLQGNILSLNMPEQGGILQFIRQ